MRMTDRVARRTALCAVGVFVPFCGTLAARPKKRKTEQTAIIAGTVFRGLGFSFPGVGITVVDKASPKKKRRGTTDRRGEFTVQVPSGEAVYLVTAKAKGFAALEKEVEIYGMERVSINFRLAPEKGPRQ